MTAGERAESLEENIHLVYARAHKIRVTSRPRGYSLKFSGKSVANTVKSFVKISVSRYTRVRAHNTHTDHRRGARSSLSSHTSRYSLLRVHNTHTYKLCTYTLACNRTFRESFASFGFPPCVRACVWGCCVVGRRLPAGRHVLDTRARRLYCSGILRDTRPRNTLYTCSVG